MSRAVLHAVAVAFALTALLPFAAAHGAPAPRDQDTRLLHDFNDDCGSDDAGGLARCGGSHDVIALDVIEAYDATLGDVVVFRLILNGQPASGLRDVVSFKAGAASRSFELQTSDNQRFTASGADRVSQATSVNDGTRFAVEATLRAGPLGGVGTKLTEYRVEAFRGTARGDVMPGSYEGALVDPDEGSQPTKYDRPEYALRGPSYYVTLGATPAEGGSTLRVTNALRTTAQAVQLAIEGRDGLEASFVSASGAEQSTMTVDLARAAFQDVALRFAGDGVALVTATTGLGGRTQLEVTGEGVATPVSPGSPSDGEDSNGKGAPALPAILTFAALAALAGMRRRT